MKKTNDKSTMITINQNNENKKNSLIYFIAMVIAGTILIYWSLPTYMQYFSSNRSIGKVIRLERTKLVYTYFNAFDNQFYELERNINKKEFDKLKDQKEVIVDYPRFFPTGVIIEGIDKKRSILLPIVVHIIILLAVLAYGKDAWRAYFGKG